MSIEHLKVKTNCVIWNNIRLPHPNKSLRSSVFSFRELKWQFEVSCTWSQRGFGMQSEENWKFNIKCVTDPASPNPHIITPYVKAAKKYVRLASTIIGTNIWRSSLLNIIGHEDTITVLFYLSPDSLMLLDVLEMAVTHKVDSDEGKNNLCVDLKSLSNDIVKLFNKDEYADVTLKCGSKSFSVQRSILAARSTVFSSMFQKDSSEKQTSVVEISDLDPNILELFLLYLYSGKVSELHIDTAIKLYKMAHKYAVSSLRQFCASYIVSRMAKNIVCEVLLLADEAKDPEFLDSVASSAARITGYLKSSEWEEFAIKYPSVAVKVYFKYHKSLIH